MSADDEQRYVATDPAHGVIYGVVPASSPQDAVAAAVVQPWLMSEPWFECPQEWGPLDNLLDGVWREVAPAGPVPNGDHSEWQVGDSLSRRFALLRPDGQWAVLTWTWFLSDDSDDSSLTEDARRGRMLEREEEYVITSDLRELDTSECDYLFDVEYDYPLTEAGVRQAALDGGAECISWDGKVFW